MSLGPGGKDRAGRVAERVRAELMDCLLRGDVGDPAVQGLYISAVRVSKDLRHARVYVRLTDTASASETQRVAALRGMERAGAFLRRSIGPQLNLRYVPEMRFFWDETTDSASRIEEILAEERREGEPR